MAPKHKQTPKKLTEPPLECTQSEYTNNLLPLAQSLSSHSEACEELLECSRYGEIDAVRAILDTWSSSSSSSIIDCTDAKTGSTPLHKSSANGHESTTRLLLYRGAKRLVKNDSGNTALHWAASAGHDVIVKLFLDSFDSSDDEVMDVLDKNKFGRSILTEGFASKNEKVIKLLLEHDSASEDRLLMGGKEECSADDDDDDEGKGVEEEDVVIGNDSSSVDTNGSSSMSASVVHEFDFLSRIQADAGEDDDDNDKKKTLFIRELPITHADNPFGEEGDPSNDTTGLGIWCASLVMSKWLSSSSSFLSRFQNKTILELGSGCGVPGLAVGLYHGDAKKVYVSDWNSETVDNLRHNVRLNRKGFGDDDDGDDRVEAIRLDWDDQSTWPKNDGEEDVQQHQTFDFIIGSDLIYQSSIVPHLRNVILGLLKPNASFLYVCPDTGRDGLTEFIQSMKNEDDDDDDALLECVFEEVAPSSFCTNPLENGDDDECFLHFHELNTMTYVLYEFRRKS